MNLPQLCWRCLIYASDDSPRRQAGGFWNDAGVSSHTGSSVHAHKRDKAHSNLCIAWHSKRLGCSCFYPGELTLEPANTIELSVCKRTTHIFFCEKTKVESVSPTAGGAPFIALRERSGLQARD